MIFKTILFTCIIFSIFGCTTNLEEVDKVTNFKEQPMEVSYDTEIIYSSKGLIKVKMVAPYLERYVGDNAYLEMPKGVDLSFFNGHMEIKSRLTSKYAIKKDIDNTCLVTDSVVLINIQGDILRTEHLVWDANKEIIFSDEFVKIKTPNQIIMGNGFKSNQDFTKYTMKKITAIINFNKDGKGI